MQKIVLIFLVMILFGCPDSVFNKYGYNYNQASFPEEPVNLELINSEFDDYNSTAPWFLETIPLIFSSNRMSMEGKMDFIYYLMSFEFDKTTGEFSVYNETRNNLDVTIQHNSIPFLLKKINHSATNEFGPYIISYLNLAYLVPDYNQKDWSDLKNDFLILYASDPDGNLDIFYHNNYYDEQEPVAVNSINSEFNEAYPCFDQDFNKLLFCSDKNGQYDIFQVDWDDSKMFEASLSDPEIKNWQEVEVLNSDGEDKCPYIFHDLLVFSSNRAGGYGGFDLYYSLWKNNAWSDPINFGEKINTSHNEFRPIIQYNGQYTNKLMIFSSDRPGGKGGYDLYFVGVNPE